MKNLYFRSTPCPKAARVVYSFWSYLRKVLWLQENKFMHGASIGYKIP
jgi:hypothetical protein